MTSGRIERSPSRQDVNLRMEKLQRGLLWRTTIHMTESRHLINIKSLLRDGKRIKCT